MALASLPDRALTPRSSRFIWLMKRSRKTPEQETTTSMRGRPSSSRGMSSSLFTRPIESATGLTPARHSTCASDSPEMLTREDKGDVFVHQRVREGGAWLGEETNHKPMKELAAAFGVHHLV